MARITKLRQWVKQDGTAVDMADMNTEHLKNALKMVRRQRQRFTDMNGVAQLVQLMGYTAEDVTFANGIANRNAKFIMTCDAAIKGLLEELETRDDAGDLTDTTPR